MDGILKTLLLKYRAFKNLFFRAFGILNAGQKRTYAISLVSMFVSSLLELFSLGLLVPFITALVSPGTFTSVTLLRGMSRPLLQSIVQHPAAGLGLLVLAFFSIKNLVNYYFYATYNRFVYSVAADLSKDKIFQYYRMQYPEYQKSNIAENLHRIAFIPIEFSQHIILGSMIILSETMLVVFFATTMAMIQFKIFIFTVLCMFPVVAIAWMLSMHYLRTTRKIIQERSASNLRTLADSLSVYQEVNLYHTVSFFSERYAEGQRDLNEELGKLNAANAIPAKLSELFAVLGMLLILFFYFRTGEHSAASVVTVMTVFVAFAYRVIPSFNRILNAVVHMHTYAFTVDLIAPAPSSGRAAAFVEDSNRSPMEFHTSIELRGITYGYPGQTRPVLRNLSLRVNKSDFIGIAGRSGAGKTSLVRILLQLIKQTSGDIMVDGKKILASDLPSWQNLFCYVAQDPVILSESIKENIAFGVPEGLIDRASVERILTQAGLSDFVQQLPRGIDSVLGERGNNLSGGQKQRIAIARALYRNAQIFIFDEAFNELDNASTEELFVLARSLHESGKTIMVISHHYRALSLCKTLYTLRGGRLHKTEKLVMDEILE